MDSVCSKVNIFTVFLPSFAKITMDEDSGGCTVMTGTDANGCMADILSDPCSVVEEDNLQEQQDEVGPNLSGTVMKYRIPQTLEFKVLLRFGTREAVLV